MLLLMRAARAPILVLVSLALLSWAACAGPENEGPENESGRIGYSLGNQIGGDLALQGGGVDESELQRGLRDGLGGADPKLPPDEMKALLLEFKRSLRARQREQALGLPRQGEPSNAARPPANEKGQLGYSIGYQVGSDFRRQDIEIDPEMMVQGVHDAVTGAKPALTEDQMRATLAVVQRRTVESARAKREEQARRNLAAGKAFLAANGARKGVTATASGLQYEVIQKGSGPHPEPKAKVTVNYRGTLIDGTEFDSSYARNEPATFRLEGLIPAWQEALPLMSEGATWKLFVPPDLGYGERGSGKIPPNATLVFEVELLSANAH
jgi:FKBP-type peptidyl-prolyl cis-trans isomerase FklB